MKTITKHAPAILAIIGLAGLALTLSWSAIVNIVAKADPPPSCTTSNVYYANQAPVVNGKPSHDFGPNQTSHDLATVSKRFENKMQACGGDSIFTTTTVAFVNQGLSLNAASAEANAKALEADKLTWDKVTKTFTSNVAKYTVGYDSRDYATLGMVPHGSKLPSLVRSTQNVKVGWALYVHMKDGTVREFRIYCDFQPVGHFPHVPTSEHPVPPSPHKPTCTDLGTCKTGGCTSGCSTPGCTHSCGSTTPSGCTHNCGGHTTPPPVHKTCPCVTPTQVQIPVQEPGYPTVYNSNAPSARPSQQPTQPVNTGNPAPPTQGGYNGGSTSQPGTTAPPVQVVPTDGPTNTGDPGGF